MTPQRQFFNDFDQYIKSTKARLLKGKGFEVFTRGGGMVVQTLGIHGENLLSLAGYEGDKNEAVVLVTPFVPELELRFFDVEERTGRKPIGFSVSEAPNPPGDS
jgi:hypothetical protein